jgi:predicted GNAT family acetyltransferase
MLRKLTEADRRSALDYLAQDPSFNVFTIGDIENFGFDREIQELWGDFDRGAVGFRAVVLRYFNTFIVSSSGEDLDRDAVCRILDRFQGSLMLSGKLSIVESLAPALDLKKIKRQYLAELRSAGDLIEAPVDEEVEWAASLSTIEEMIAVQDDIDEFAALGVSPEAVIKNFESGSGRTVIVRRDGQIVSAASSAAESSRAAMIIGVFTDKRHRGQGLASACMRVLCRRLLESRDAVCLFYDNPAAGRIYKRLGFRDIGRWAMAQR